MMKLAPTITTVATLALLLVGIVAWLEVSGGESAQAPQLGEARTREPLESPTLSSPLELPAEVGNPEASTDRTEARAPISEAASVWVHAQWEGSGAPAADVAVRCRSWWGSQGSDSDRRSDANGVVLFEGLRRGPIALQTEFGGHATALVPRNGRVDVELIVPNTAAVVGHVVDKRKLPVAHAVIWCAPFGFWTPIATSDANGFFRLARGSQGQYLAASSPNGALGRTRRIPSIGLSEYTLDLVAGGEGCRLVGRVVDERDAPLADVVVVVDPRKTMFEVKTGRTLRSDREGRFVVSNLSPRTHDLRLSLAPFAPFEEQIDLEPSEDFERVFRLSAGIAFTGTVRRNGEPQPGALVFVGDFFAEPHNSAVTDASGAFRLTGLRPGEQTAAAVCAFKDGDLCDLLSTDSVGDAELWVDEATIDFQPTHAAVHHFKLQPKPDGEAVDHELSDESPASDQ